MYRAKRLTNASGTVTAFPPYDAHGNNVASLTRSGTGYSVNDRRSYDAWGVVRAQQSAGDPKLRYCASLGHRQDDESGLVYMRARYYEPGSGRFISEDPSYVGTNWFAYCNNDPVNYVDYDGKDPLEVTDSSGFNVLMGITLVSVMAATFAAEKDAWEVCAAWVGLGIAAACIALGDGTNMKSRVSMIALGAPALISAGVAVVAAYGKLGKTGVVGLTAGAAMATYTFVILGCLLDLACEGVDFDLGGN